MKCLGGRQTEAYVSDRPLRLEGNTMYLLAIFCSPLALLFAGKPFQALFNLILFVLALALTLSIIFSWAGIALWIAGVAHAVLVINNAREDRRTRRIVAAMERR